MSDKLSQSTITASLNNANTHTDPNKLTEYYKTLFVDSVKYNIKIVSDIGGVITITAINDETKDRYSCEYSAKKIKDIALAAGIEVLPNEFVDIICDALNGVDDIKITGNEVKSDQTSTQSAFHMYIMWTLKSATGRSFEKKFNIELNYVYQEVNEVMNQKMHDFVKRETALIEHIEQLEERLQHVETIHRQDLDELYECIDILNKKIEDNPTSSATKTSTKPKQSFKRAPADLYGLGTLFTPVTPVLNQVKPKTPDVPPVPVPVLQQPAPIQK